MQQHIQQHIVNAVEDEGFYRSPEVNRVIDKVSESLAAALDSAVEEFIYFVDVDLGPERAQEARDLFVTVGLAEAEPVEESVDNDDVKAQIAEWIEKGKSLLASL